MGYGDLSSADWARIRTQRDPLLEAVYPIPYRPPAGGPGPSPVESYQEPKPKESPLQREVHELRSRVRELEGRLASQTEARTQSTGPYFALSFPSAYETKYEADTSLWRELQERERKERQERRRDDMIIETSLYKAMGRTRSEAETLLKESHYRLFSLDRTYAINEVYGCNHCSGVFGRVGYTGFEALQGSPVPSDLKFRRIEAVDKASDYWIQTGRSRGSARIFMVGQGRWSEDEIKFLKPPFNPTISYALNEVYGCMLCSNPGYA